MPFYTEYISYFESLARKHTDIAHTDSDCHFTPVSLDDFKNNIVSKIKFNHLLLLKPDYLLVSDRSDSVIKKYIGQLMILGKISERETTSANRNTIVDSLEAISDEIIARIINDIYRHNEAGAGLFHATPVGAQISGNPIGASDVNQYFLGSAGWFLQFEILWPIDGVCNPAKWTDPENLED